MVNNCSQSDKKGKNIPSNTKDESQSAVENTSYSSQNLSEEVNDSIPAPSVFNDESSTRYDPPHASTRPWIKQTSISKSFPLRDHQKGTEFLVTGLTPPDTVKAWLRRTLLLKDWGVNTHLCEIINGVYVESPTESPNIELGVVHCNWRQLRDGKKIKIRWL